MLSPGRSGGHGASSQVSAKASAREGKRPATGARRVLRRVRRSVIFTLGIVALLFVVVSQTGVLRVVMLPRLEQMLDCRVNAGRVTLTATGAVVVRDLSLEVRGIPGPGGRFLEAPRLRLVLDWRRLVHGQVVAQRIELRRPVIRLSQGQDMSINIAGVRRTSTTTAPTSLPAVEVYDGRLELGEHGPGAAYQELAVLRVGGWMRPMPDNPDALLVRLRELQGRGSWGSRPGDKPGGMVLEGRADFKAGTAELHLMNVDLAAWSQRPAPSSVNEVWRQMAMRGAIRQTVLRYERDREMTASFELEDVDLNIPVPVEEQAVAEAAAPAGAQTSTRWLGMRGVSGTVSFDSTGLTADLNGNLGDLPAGVYLRTKGLSLDAELECRIGSRGFRIAERPQLLPYAPKVVRKLFQRFSAPTAEVDGVVVITRGPPTEAGPAALSVSGTLELRHGRAEYEKFPYPVTDLSGFVTFNAQRVEIVRISGVGPTGARLEASGVVEPPTDGSEVAIGIRVTDMPLDGHFRDAMPDGKRGVYTALFNEEAYEGLRAAGLVRAPGDEPALRARLEEAMMRLREAERRGGMGAVAAREREVAAAERALAAPEFAVGGVANLDIKVRRALGPDTPYLTRIDVRAERAGILTPVFPYPAWAKGVSIHIGEQEAEIPEMQVTGLSGAAGTLSGRVEFASASGHGSAPYLSIAASKMPVDDYLLHALPDEGDEGDPERFSTRRLLKELGLDGAVSGAAEIFPRPADPGDERPVTERSTAFRVDVNIDGLSARPGQGRVELRDIVGELQLTPDEVRMDGLTARLGDGEASLQFLVTRPEPGAALSRVEAVTNLTGLELSLPLEDLISPVSREGGAAYSEFRVETAVRGRVDAAVVLSNDTGGDGFTARVTNPVGVGFNAMGADVGITDASGVLVVRGDSLAFESFDCGVVSDGVGPSRVRLDGELTLSPTGSSVLGVVIDNGRLESGLMRAVVDRGTRGVGVWMAENGIGGAFGATVRLERAAGRTVTTGRFEPRSVSLVRQGVRVELAEASGGVTFGPEGGVIDGLRGGTDEWSLTADGTWTAGDGVVVDTVLGFESTGLSEELRVLLPAEVGATIRAIDLEVDGAVSMPQGRLWIAAVPGVTTRAVFDGALAFSGVSMDPGLPVRSAQGSVVVRAVGGGAEGEEPLVELAFEVASMEAAGVLVTDVRGSVESGRTPEVLTIEDLRARVHGGMVTVQGLIGPVGPAAARGYEIDAEIGGVAFGPLLDDAAPGDGREALMPRALASESGEDRRGRYRGHLDGSMRVRGWLGDTASRRGRGILRVQGEPGRAAVVMRLPGVLPLLRLSNLQVPLGERLDFAFTEFHLEGRRVVFDELSVRSRSISIEGNGWMLLPEAEVALRFNTRSLSRLPILTDLFEGMRNELVTTVVSGSVYDPHLRFEQLSETRGLLDGGAPRRRRRAETTGSE